MFDLKSAREEMARIHAEASKHVEKYSAADAAQPTDDESKAQEERFSKLEKISKQIEDAERLAKFAFSKEQPVAAIVVKDVKHPDQVAVERAAAKAVADISHESYSAQLSAFVKGEDRESYAALTTTSGSGVFLPSQVTQAINLTNINPYRQGLSFFGLAPVSYGSTAKVTNPVVSPFSGSALPEDGSSDTSADANAKIGSMIHTPKGYQSGSFWYSGLEIGALNYDVTTSHLPALMAASDLAAAAAVTAAIKADSAVTLSVTTASTSTITQANIDALLNKVAQVYRSRRVLHLSQTAYALVEALADSQGRPLLTPDLQNQSLLRYRGVPVVMDPTLDATGTSTNLVGMVISYTAFEWRDEQDKLMKFVGESANPDKTGLNHIRYADGAYYAAGIAKLVN